MLRQRHDTDGARAAGISEFMRDCAYLASIEFARARPFPMQRRPVTSGGNFASRCRRRSRTRSACTASATRTCSRSPPPAPSACLRRQRVQRHEPPFSWTYTEEAHGGRHAQGIPSRTTRGALSPPARREREAVRIFRDRVEQRRRAPGDGGGGTIDTSTEDGERARGLSVREFEGLYMKAWKSG